MAEQGELGEFCSLVLLGFHCCTVAHLLPVRFEYEPAILRDVLFDPLAFGRRPPHKSSNLHHRPHKRRRLELEIVRPHEEDEKDDDDDDDPRDIVLETLTEKFLVQAYDEEPSINSTAEGADKENIGTGTTGMDVDATEQGGQTGAGDLEMELGVPPPFMPPKPTPERKWMISLIVDEGTDGAGEAGSAEEEKATEVSEEKAPAEPEPKVAEDEDATPSNDIPAAASEGVEKAQDADATSATVESQAPSTETSAPPLPATSEKQPTPPVPATEPETLAAPSGEGNKNDASPSAQPSPLPPLPPPSPTVSNLSSTSDLNRTKSFSTSSGSKPNSKSTVKKVRIAEALLPLKSKDEKWKKNAKVLQRDLTPANFDFVKGEVRVLGDVGEDGTRKGWAIEVRRWWWA